MADFKPFNPNEFLGQNPPPPVQQVNPAQNQSTPQAAVAQQPVPCANGGGYNSPPPTAAQGNPPAQQQNYNRPPPQNYNQPPQNNYGQPQQVRQWNDGGNGSYQGGNQGRQQWRSSNGPRKPQTNHFNMVLTRSKTGNIGKYLSLTDLGREVLQQNSQIIKGISIVEWPDALNVALQQGIFGKRTVGQAYFKFVSDAPPYNNQNQRGYNQDNGNGNGGGGYYEEQ